MYLIIKLLPNRRNSTKSFNNLASISSIKNKSVKEVERSVFDFAQDKNAKCLKPLWGYGEISLGSQFAFYLSDVEQIDNESVLISLMTRKITKLYKRQTPWKHKHKFSRRWTKLKYSVFFITWTTFRSVERRRKCLTHPVLTVSG